MNWTLRRRLLASFSLIIAIMLAMVGLTYEDLHDVELREQHMQKHPLPGLYYSALLRSAALQDLVALQRLVLDQDLNISPRDQTQMSLLFIDVDCFKSYNDDLGHLAGDDLLRQVAVSMRESCTRPADLPARYGGDEFVMLLPGTPSSGARVVAEKIREAMLARRIEHNFPTRGSIMTLSIGGATLTPMPGESPQLLIQLADQGLYCAKNQGRNRVKTLERPVSAA